MKVLYHHLIVILSLAGLGFGLFNNEGRKRIQQKKSNLGIINGKNTTIENFPFMVSFTIDGDFMGSGVILNEHWILTTAYIVAWESLSEVKIRIGSDGYGDGGEIVEAKKIIFPDSYTGQWDSDIGLVKVKKPMKFSKKVKKIKLGTAELKNQTKAIVTGWGATSEDSIVASSSLRTTKLTVLDHKSCTSYYSGLTKTFCTFDTKNGVSSYDFGDPLVLEGKLYGLFVGCDGYNPGVYPMIFTDITKYIKWINSYIIESKV